MKYFITAICCLIFSVKSFSQSQWILAGKSHDGDAYYVQSKFISKSDIDGSVRLWVKVVERKHVIGKKIYSNTIMKQLVDFDCSLKRQRLNTVVIYSSSGSVLAQYPETDDEEWMNVVPDSVGEDVNQKVCELFN